MRNLIVVLCVLSVLAICLPASAEPSVIVKIQRQGHGMAIWTVDTEGNWVKARQSGRVIGKGKFDDKQFTELTKSLDGINWAEIKELYTVGENDEGQQYDLVITVKGKEHKLTVVNPGTVWHSNEGENKDAPESIRSIMRTVIKFMETGTPKFGGGGMGGGMGK